MALGDIGAVVETVLQGTTIVGGDACRIGTTDIWAIVSGGGIRTYYFNPTNGDIGTVIDTASGWGNLLHVNGSIYVSFSNGYPTNNGQVVTYTITDAGDISAAIATNTTLYDGFERGRPFEVADTGIAKIYGMIKQGGVWNSKLYLRIISVSYDGLTISSLSDNLIESTGTITNCYAASCAVGGTVFAVAVSWEGAGELTKVHTVNITSAGVVTVLDSETFGTGRTQTGYSPSITSLGSGKFALTYYEIATTLTTLVTFPISGAGIVGAVIDTSTTKFPTTTWMGELTVNPKSIGGGVYIYSYNDYSLSRSTVATISLPNSGMIGNVIDTQWIHSLVTDGKCTVHALNTSFCAVTDRYSTNIYLNTIPVTGMDDTATTGRVGSIRHLYRPGFYRADITLGGYEIQKVLPEDYSEVNLDEELLTGLAKSSDQRIKTRFSRPNEWYPKDPPLNPYIPGTPEWNEFLVTSKSTRPMRWETKLPTQSIKLPTQSIPEVTGAIQSDIEANIDDIYREIGLNP